MAWGEQGNKITWIPNVVSDDKKLNGGWYDDPSSGYNRRWWTGSPDGGSSSSSNGFSIPQPDVEAINREYAPIYENYDRDEQNLKNMESSEETMLNENFAQAKTTLDKSKVEREGYKNEQEKSLNNQYRSAYEEAVRGKQALDQQGNVRFGGGSSAGRAMNEIADREFYRQSGKVQNTHMENLGKLQSDWSKFLSWDADERQRLELEKRQSVTKLKNQFTQLFTQIMNNRNITKSEQARTIRGAQEQYQARKADVENQVRASQLAMDEYGKKLRMELDAQIELAGKTKFAVADNTFSNDVQSEVNGVNYIPSQGGVPMSTNYVNPFLARARYSDDEFEDNPYFA